MQYRNGCGDDRLSILAFGCMRFTKKGTSIDLDKADREVMEAFRSGVNYFDSAYIYGGSEVALGEILKRNHIRNQVNIATKLPQFLVRSKAAIDKYFEEQLKRLQTDYIDYYLMHMITDVASWERLVGFGIREWIAEKKAKGQIRHIGFSFHGNTEMFLQVLNAYDWDFCMIQYNYMDEYSQVGKKGLLAAKEKGIPVMIMEPLRGGKLVSLLPQGAKKIIEEHPKKRSPAEWAFRWLWNQGEVTTVLSGMNSVEMVQENVRIASEVQVGEFDGEDFNLVDQIKAEINTAIKVNCTGCAYCMPCPKGVDIPGAFRCYNLKYTEGKRTAIKEYAMVTAARKEPSNASNCIGCGKCEQHCPQEIPIRQELKKASKELETPGYKAFKLGYRIIKPW
jgi:predicted aldo/keto reductase-like oxidoreductase